MFRIIIHDIEQPQDPSRALPLDVIKSWYVVKTASNTPRQGDIVTVSQGEDDERTSVRYRVTHVEHHLELYESEVFEYVRVPCDVHVVHTTTLEGAPLGIPAAVPRAR